MRIVDGVCRVVRVVVSGKNREFIEPVNRESFKN